MSKHKKPFEVTKVMKFPVFMGYKLIIVLTKDKEKSYKRAIKGSNIDPDMNFSAVHVFRKNAISYLIFDKKSVDPGTIAHECWHFVRHLLVNWAGVELDNEVVAYYIGFLVNEVYTFINEKKGTI